MEFILYKFNHLVTRDVKYPHDVVLRKNVHIFVSSQKWTPSPTHADLYQRWPYGEHWYPVLVPGSAKLELVFDNHLKESGIRIEEDHGNSPVRTQIPVDGRSNEDRKP